MIVLPAIDLKDGRCVRLLRGEFSTVHTVADDPVSVAQAFADAGAVMLHMVDLDGARGGVGKNREIVKTVINAMRGRLSVELGGGIRSLADIEAALALGVHRVVLGSAAVSDLGLVTQSVKRYGAHIAVGIDALEGRVRTAGWTQDSGLDCIEFAKRMEAAGVETIIFTDIETDGALNGPGLQCLTALRAAVSCRIVASGGVTVLEDIRRLKQAGMEAAIIGKALYAGTIDLAQAIREAGEQCLQNV